MKGSFVLSGAIHALFFLALLLGGLPRGEVSAPGVIQVLLLDGAGGEGRKPAAPSAGDAAGLRRAGATRSVRMAETHPVRPAARRVRRSKVERTGAATPPARVKRVTIAEPSPQQEAPVAHAGEAATGRASRSAAGNDSRGQDGPASMPGGVGQADGTSGEGPSGRERDHRIAIIRQRIQEALVYPREARRRGIEGTSQVRFDLDDAGRLRTLALERSSGRKLLDDASLDTVERAQPFPFVDGTLIVPVVFRLSGMRRP